MIAVILALIAVISTSQAAKYTVWIGFDDPKTGFNINKNIPSTLRIHPGDKVIFKQKSFDPHTVTFHPGTDLPDAFINGVEANLPVITPSVLDGPYDGTTFLTSGMMAKGTPLTSFEVEFSTEGKFEYGCAVHGQSQNGSIIVVPKGKKIPAPKAIKQQQKKWQKRMNKMKKKVLKRAQKSVPASIDNGDGTHTHYVRMGYFEAPHYEFLAFFQRVTKVHPGDKIEWFGAVFHTVTFLNGAEVPPLVAMVDGTLQLNPDVYIPTGHSILTRDEFINGGLFVDPASRYTLTVGEGLKGKIEYICIPHVTSGMKGVIQVVQPKKKKTG